MMGVVTIQLISFKLIDFKILGIDKLSWIRIPIELITKYYEDTQKMRIPLEELMQIVSIGNNSIL